MKNVSVCLAIVGLLTCWGCAITDIESTANLSQYKTFGWGKSNFKVSNPVYKSELIEANMKTTIKNEFAKKGVTHSTKKPDLLVSYEAYTETIERVYRGGMYYYPNYFPYYSYRFFPYGGYMMGWGPVWTEPQGSYSYTRGTLILEMKDRKTGALVWRGLVQGSVDNVKALNKNITKGVKAIMRKYPVAPPPVMPLPKEKIS